MRPPGPMPSRRPPGRGSPTGRYWPGSGIGWSSSRWPRSSRQPAACARVDARTSPRPGGVLLVSNHLSHLDVFVLGILVPRPLNYVARSTLFLPLLGPLIRSVGGFPIQREGMGASGLKETLRRLRNGGIVVLFPEGTRSIDGELGELKPGSPYWPHGRGCRSFRQPWRARSRPGPAGDPSPGPTRSGSTTAPHYSPRRSPDLDPEAIVALIRTRMLACQQVARDGLQRDLGRCPDRPRPVSSETRAASD